MHKMSYTSDASGALVQGGIKIGPEYRRLREKIDASLLEGEMPFFNSFPKELKFLGHHDGRMPYCCADHALGSRTHPDAYALGNTANEYRKKKPIYGDIAIFTKNGLDIQTPNDVAHTAKVVEVLEDGTIILESKLNGLGPLVRHPHYAVPTNYGDVLFLLDMRDFKEMETEF